MNSRVRWTMHDTQQQRLGTFTRPAAQDFKRVHEAFFCPVCAEIWALAKCELPCSSLYLAVTYTCERCGDGTISRYFYTLELDSELLEREFFLELKHFDAGA